MRIRCEAFYEGLEIDELKDKICQDNQIVFLPKHCETKWETEVRSLETPQQKFSKLLQKISPKIMEKEQPAPSYMNKGDINLVQTT